MPYNYTPHHPYVFLLSDLLKPQITLRLRKNYKGVPESLKRNIYRHNFLNKFNKIPFFNNSF